MSNAAAFAQLATLRGRVAAVASGRAAREVREACAVAAREQIEAGFRREESPYGVPWKPLKEPRAGKILTDSGALRASWAVRATARGLAIASTAVYAAYQHAARPIVPLNDRLGPRWTRAFERAADAVMKRYLP